MNVRDKTGWNNSMEEIRQERIIEQEKVLGSCSRETLLPTTEGFWAWCL